MLPSLIC
nr:unnamed protein product [Callosobruchus chinensis]